MVVTRKQAAENGHPPHTEEAMSPDVSPDSNLNLLASSASCEALSAGVGRKTPGSSLYMEGEPHPGHILTDAAVLRLKHEPSSADDSTEPRSAGPSSATEIIHGSASHIAVGPAQSSVPAIVVMPPASSSSSQIPVQGTAPLSGQLWTVGDGEKAGVGRQYKIVYKTLKPLTSSAPMVLGVSGVLSPPAQPAPPPPPQVLFQADPGTTSQRTVVPGSQPPALAAGLLGSSATAVKTPGRSSALQGAGSAPGVPASRTVIFVSPTPPPSTTSTVGGVLGSAGSSTRTSPPQLLPAGGTSSLKPGVSQALLSSLHGVTPGSAAAGVVSHTTSLPEPGVSHTAWSGQSASTSDPHAGGHSAPYAATVAVSSALLSGHSVSQALFQLAHTAKAELMGHTVSSANPAQIHAATPVAATGQGFKIISNNAQILPVAVPGVGGISTVRITGVPGPLKDSSALSVPMVTALPEHTQTSAVLASRSFPSTQPSASLTAASDGSARLSMHLSTMSDGGGVGSGLGEGEAVTWDRACTLGLIQLYKEHQVYLADPHYKKKSVWELIASKLRQTVPDGPPFRWNHVENKWKNMTKKFRDCVNLNRRSGTVVSKCNFFDEIAAIYNYSPTQDQRKVAEGLRALKSTPHKHTTAPSLVNTNNNNSGGFAPTSAGESSSSAGTVSSQMQNGSSQTDHHGSKRAARMEDVPLVKKKKYAHLDGQLPSCSRPGAAAPHSTVLPPPPPAELKGGGVDVAGLLQRLREDRARQERSRMDRLERMHQEKMAMFGRFLAILQRARPPDKE